MKIKYTFLLFLLIIVFSCKKDKNLSLKNLNNDKVSVFGHGGMGIHHLYPMNSLEGILLSLSLGADGTEIDIQITSDGVIVGYHDEGLITQTDFFGKINDWPWEEIKKYPYVRQPYSNYKIVSLATIFSNIPNLHSYVFTFDCKLYSNTNNYNQYLETYSDSIAAIVKQYKLEENIFIESQDGNFLVMLQKKIPQAKLFIYPPSFDEGMKIAEELGLYGMTISTELINRKQVDYAHSKGIYIALFNVHSFRRNRQGIEKSPDFIQTDRLEHLLKVLK